MTAAAATFPTPPVTMADLQTSIDNFTAKLTDVYPDGRSILLMDGIVRARFRASLADPSPVRPGERYA